MTQIKLRRDTAANFTSKNPVLGQGEPAYETDTKKMKIGDGTTAYNDLTYFDAGGGTAPSNMVTTNTVQTLTNYKYMPALLFGTASSTTIGINNSPACINMDYYGDISRDASQILLCQPNFWQVGRYDLAGQIGSNTPLVRMQDTDTQYPIFDTSNISNYVDGSTITWNSSTKKLSSSGGGGSTSKAEIVKWCAPDFSTKIAQNNNAEYTADYTGWLEVKTDDYNTTTYLTIDGDRRAINGSGDNHINNTYHWMLLPKGTMYKIEYGRVASAEFNYMNFYKCIGEV